MHTHTPPLEDTLPSSKQRWVPQPGFSLGFPDWGSTHSVSVVETDYKEYALLFSQGTKGPGQDFHMATLYSRSPTPQAPTQGPLGWPGMGSAEN